MKRSSHHTLNVVIHSTAADGQSSPHTLDLRTNAQPSNRGKRRRSLRRHAYPFVDGPILPPPPRYGWWRSWSERLRVANSSWFKRCKALAGMPHGQDQDRVAIEYSKPLAMTRSHGPVTVDLKESFSWTGRLSSWYRRHHLDAYSLGAAAGMTGYGIVLFMGFFYRQWRAFCSLVRSVMASYALRSVAVVAIGVFGIVASIWIGKFLTIVMKTNIARAEQEGQQGVHAFVQGGHELLGGSFDQAQQSFQGSENAFRNAQAVLGSVSEHVGMFVLDHPWADQPMVSPLGVLEAGRQIATIAAHTSQAIAALVNFSHGSIDEQSLKTFSVDLHSNAKRLEEISAFLRGTDLSVVASAYQQSLPAIADQLLFAAHVVDQLGSVEDIAPTVTGQDRAMRYLMVFENNAEMRPAGGFFGSMALVDVDRGKLTNLQVPGGGPYDMQGSLNLRYQAPMPLHLLKPHWQFQDANWFADWPTSAKTIAQFYEHAGGSSVDGVIALTTTAAEHLLDVAGPLNTSSHALISKDNFYNVTQRAVEEGYDKTHHTPKAFIGELAQEFLKGAGAWDDAKRSQIVTAILDLIAQKHILLYASDPSLEHTLADLGVSGEIGSPQGDSMMVVRANIGGAKTDRVITKQYRHTTHVFADHRIIDRVELTFTHQGQKGTAFTGGVHREYLRLYVPQGSALKRASGLDAPPIDQFKPEPKGLEASSIVQERMDATPTSDNVYRSREFGRTVFGGWFDLKPGQTRTIVMEYALPDHIVDAQGRYRWIFEKQPGETQTTVTKLYEVDPGSSRTISNNEPVEFSGDYNKVIEAVIR